tara:strand:- start:27277 stop:28458 length:1182 start_codon:yes stop_codon:yes gene_type:complete
MNFVESLSLSSGLKINKPFIDDLFFPIIFDKYITFSTENHQSKQWDHLQECIDILNPILDKEGIRIIEIGNNDQRINNVINLKGVTKSNHWSYIIKKSSAHFGPENFMSQLCSLFEIPSVVLFSNTSTDYTAPTWSNDKNKETFLTPNKKDWKASFSAEENPKVINSISAESVAFEVLKMLGIKNSFNNFNVISTGAHYHQKLIEIIPDFNPDPNFFPRSLLNIRMDYHFNEESLPAFANNRKIAIITDKEININTILKLKPSIERIIFKIDESSSQEYIKNIKLTRVPLTLVAKEKSNLPLVRLKFFDYKIEEENKKIKKDLDNSEEICDTTRYKSSKYIFSKEGKFSSKSSYDKGIKSHDNQIIINDNLFWEESDHYKIYNLKRDERKKDR